MSTIAKATHPETSSSLKHLLGRHPLVAYFVIAFAGTWIPLLPFAFSRGRYGLGLLPYALPDAIFYTALILSALAGPALASLVVTASISGGTGVRHLLRRCIQWRASIGWYPIIIFGFLLVYLLSYSLIIEVNLGVALLAHWQLLLTVFLPQAVFVVLTSTLAEELGWRGFALPRLQHHYGPIWGSLILGVLHGLWYLPAFFTLDMGPFRLSNYAGFLFVTTAVTFLFTWIFNHTRGSVLLMAFTHGFGDAADVIVRLLIPTHLLISGWAQPIVKGNWQGIDVLSFGLCALLLIVFTRGRLGYQPEQNAQLITER